MHATQYEVQPLHHEKPGCKTTGISIAQVKQKNFLWEKGPVASEKKQTKNV